MSDFDEVNFPVTISKYISSLGSHQNSKMITQKYTVTIHKQQFIVRRTKSRPNASYMIYSQNTATNNSYFTLHCEHVQKTKPLTTRYQVMLKSLVTDTVTDVLECVPKNFARVCKDINTSWPYMVSSLNDFCHFISPTLL
jgi:hypothetical protein